MTETLCKLYTPDDLARPLVRVLPFRPWDTVLEPHAGGGAFIRALYDETDILVENIFAGDIDPKAPAIEMVEPNVIIGDFLDVDIRDGFDWVIGNPPYGRVGDDPTRAEKHTLHAMDVSRQHVVFLLKSTFLNTQQRYKSIFHNHKPRHFWLLPERPSFTGGGTDRFAEYAWIWWDKFYDGPTTCDWLPWTGRL
jgi:hypothetical protein